MKKKKKFEWIYIFYLYLIFSVPRMLYTIGKKTVHALQENSAVPIHDVKTDPDYYKGKPVHVKGVVEGLEQKEETGGKISYAFKVTDNDESLLVKGTGTPSVTVRDSVDVFGRFDLIKGSNSDKKSGYIDAINGSVSKSESE